MISTSIASRARFVKQGGGRLPWTCLMLLVFVPLAAGTLTVRTAAARNGVIRGHVELRRIVRVFCDIHSHMNAFNLVFSHPFFAITDDEGRYRIDNVPPGSYNVVAWNEGLSSEPKPVMVPDGGATELDFALR